MSIGPYQEPEWAVEPSSSIPWTLTEIKAGVEVAQHDLSSRATTVLGRAVDMVHIPLHHQSISRQHARIAFDQSGTPWLRDLQSAHGTYVNKKRLPPKATGKVESNSHQKGARGIVLFVGDVIKFGASSRYFSLEGPPPEVMSEKEQHLAKLNAAVSASDNPGNSNASSAVPKNEGISWGMDMGDDDIGGEEGATANANKSIELDPSKVPEKYRKELEKINALKYKLANLETEDDRIRRKGGSELTDGQQKQLDRNAEKEAALRKSIKEREERLHDKLNPTSGDDRRRRTTENYDDEDDDFFDRTKNDDATNDFATGEAESEESLALKWKKLVGERNHLVTTLLAKANQRVQSLRNELKSMQASGNEEAFFVQNDLQLAVESKKKIEASLAKTNTALDEIEKLLKVVNPKLNCDRQVGFIGQGSPPPPKPKIEETQSSSQAFPMPAPRHVQKAVPVSMGPPAPLQTAKPENLSMPPPPPSMQRGPPTMPSESLSMDPPPNKRKRIIGPAAVPPSKPAAEDNRKLPPPRTGTLAFLNHSTTTSKAANNQSNDSAGSKISANKEQVPKPYLKATVDASKMDVWKAPEGQDGSGKTKLNEKFAGRY